MTVKDIRKAIAKLPEDEEILIYINQGTFAKIDFINKRKVTIYKGHRGDVILSHDNGMTGDLPIKETKDANFFVMK